jgi:large subunit ribosomal protein L5
MSDKPKTTTKTKAKTQNKFGSPVLQSLYATKLVDELRKELKVENINDVPSLEKVVISVGLGRSKGDKKVIEAATNTLTKITGQSPITTIAKKSIAGFKLREGEKIGLKVTLRKANMYEFTYKFINVVLPRLRDFRGVSNKSFDKSGNYSIGISEQSVFPELSFDETTTSHGLQITFTINNINPEHSKLLLQKLGMPFQKEQTNG